MPALSQLRTGTVAAIALIFLGACEAPREPGILQTVEGFAGLVAGDEPRAVIVGRDILGSGGFAADAAVAMYFTMTATLPSRVGIGGNGVCLVHTSGLGQRDRSTGIEVVEFLADPAAAHSLQMAGPRAMAVMHARHGVLRWTTLLSDAERLARSGSIVSRAFASDLDAAADFVSANQDLRKAFSNKSGELASEGDLLIFAELGGLISGLRRQGAGYLYTGAFAQRLVESAVEAGVPITGDDLREAVPTIQQPLTVPFRENYAYFPPNDGGLLAAQMWGMLTVVESYQSGSTAEKAHLLAEAGQRAFSQRHAWFSGESAPPDTNLINRPHLEKLLAGYNERQHNRLPLAQGPALQTMSNPFNAGFVVADSWSNAVACSFSLNGLFGAGRMVPGTGIILPKETQPGANNLSVSIISNPFNGTVYFAGTTSGGLAAPAALARVMLEASPPEGSVEEALAAPRLVNVANPDVTFYEPDLDPAVLSSLRQMGHALQPEPGVGRAHALKCPTGLRDNNRSCMVGTDQRGHGLSIRVQ